MSLGTSNSFDNSQFRDIVIYSKSRHDLSVKPSIRFCGTCNYNLRKTKVEKR